MYLIGSRYVGTVPNFTPASGSFLIPNTETVSSNFVLQGNSGGWVTIASTEYELFPISGYVAQRVTDRVSGAAIDWTGYASFRVHVSAQMISGTYSVLTADAAITFAEDDTGYSPVGQVGELNGEAMSNVVTSLLVAAGGNVIADDNYLMLRAGASESAYILWNDTSNNTAASIVSRALSGSGSIALRGSATAAGGSGYAYLTAENVNATNIALLTAYADDSITALIANTSIRFILDNTYNIGSATDYRPQWIYTGTSGGLDFETGSASRTAAVNSHLAMYVKNQKLVFSYKTSGGAARFFYIDLTGTANTQWIYSATEP